MPIFADQPANAQRIAEIGAGLEADHERPETIRAAVLQVLGESRSAPPPGPSPARRSRLPPIEAAESALLELVHAARERRAA